MFTCQLTFERFIIFAFVYPHRVSRPYAIFSLTIVDVIVEESDDLVFAFARLASYVD